MKNQSGRSMIEMLGVLAIIGVLSLGGVATFNAAMNRHTANNLTYDVMLMAESTVSLGPQEQMPFDASTEYNQMSSVRDANGIVNVTVQDVENDICEVLLSKAGNDVFEFRDADGNALDACADDTTDVVFAFTGDGFGGNNPVNPDENDCSGGCSTGHICVDGECCPNVIPEYACSIESTEACAGVTPPPKPDGEPCGEYGDGFCQEGDCIEWDCSGNWIGANCDICDVDNLNCGDAQDIDYEHCLCVCENEGYTGYYCSYSCPTATSNVSGLSKSACEACGNAVWNNGYCYGCGRSGTISFDTEAEAEACVAACAGSGYERYQSGKSCYLATNTTCPSENSVKYRMSKSVCETCDNTVWKNGDCYGCGYSVTISFDTEAEAEACVAACAGTGYERTAEGRYCYRSPSPECPATSSASYMSKSACEKCDNTFWKNGNCYGCGYPSFISFDTEAEAEACESACADSGYERTADGNYCYRSPSTDCPSEPSYTSNMSKSACETCENTVWKNGECYDCGEFGPIFFDTEAEAEACVSACADSGYERIAMGTECYLAETICPWEMDFNPVMTKSTCEGCYGTVWSDGYCYFCGYPDSISFDTEAEAEACVSACAGSGYERIAEGNYCYRSPSTDCPSETTFTSNMTKSVCEGCGNTFWRKGGSCYFCGYSKSIYFGTEAEAEACVSACADSGYPREVDKSGNLYYCNRK